MRLHKRWLSALLVLCMALTLLPANVLAEDVYTEEKQLVSYDSSTHTAHFADGDSIFVEVSGIDNLCEYAGYWFLVTIHVSDNNVPYIMHMELLDGGGNGGGGGAVHEVVVGELSAAVDISVSDVEKDGDTYRTAGSGGSFESASSFRLPITVTVTNTTQVSGISSSDWRYGAAVLHIRSIELLIPDRFELETPESERASWTREISLDPGEQQEYDGYLRMDDSSILRQSKELTYNLAAVVTTTDERTWDGGTSFTVTPTAPAAPQETPPPDGEYNWLPTEMLDEITDIPSAVEAVKEMLRRMTDEQKRDPDCIDIATLFSEYAAAKASSKQMGSGEIKVDLSCLEDIASSSAKAVQAVENTLRAGSVLLSRSLPKTVILKSGGSNKLDLQFNPDILGANLDKIRVETPAYALTMKVDDLKTDLNGTMRITADCKSSGSGAPLTLGLPNNQISGSVTVSMKQGSGAATYQTLVKDDGSAAAGKPNPVTRTIDARVNASGTYGVRTNQKNFTDISGKSAEMQKAILYLASKGIINGTGGTAFSPDRSISRQQIAALLMRALGKVDNTATATFTDVPKSSGLYRAIASSQRHKIINGYSDNTFRGTNVISKAQIVTVAGRVLVSEMNYNAPSNPGFYLGRYKDTVPAYAQDMVALATRENLVSYQTDGKFSGGSNMTRGEAAVILYRLFQRIW